MKLIIIFLALSISIVSCKDNKRCGRIISLSEKPAISHDSIQTDIDFNDFEKIREADRVKDSIEAFRKDTATNSFYQLEILWDNGAKTIEKEKGVKNKYHENDSYCITMNE